MSATKIGDTGLELLAGGVANATASAALNWSDVTKVRIQTQPPPCSHYPTLRSTVRTIVKEEGLICFASPLRGGLLLPGFVPSMLREMTYSSVRFGLYPVVKKLLGAEGGDIGLLKKISAGLLTGGIGSAFASPIDLVKIRFQAEAGRLGDDGKFLTGLRTGHAPQYRSTAHAFATIWKLDGLKGLYRGMMTTSSRAAFLAAAQLSSYDHTKYLLRSRFTDGISLHVLASLVAGLCATTAAQPFDVVKSRIMADSNQVLYKSGMDCFLKTCRNEGIRGVFRGWLPSYCRLGPHFIVAMPLWEYVRNLFGLGYLS